MTNDSFMTLSAPFRIFQTKINQRVDIHWHEFYEMTFIVSGTGTHILNGIPVRLEQGCAFLLTPADFHEIMPDPGQALEVYNVIFSDGFIQDDLIPHIFEMISEHSCFFSEAEYGFIENGYHRIWEEANHWREDSEFIVQRTLECMLIYLSRKCRKGEKGHQPMPPGNEPLHSAVRKSLIYIQHHFRQTLTLDQVAFYCGLSSNYFSECFRKVIGVTFQGYVKDLRLNFAKSLLKTTSFPITDICYASGFNSLPHFERAFKQKYTVSPRQLRNKKSE